MVMPPFAASMFPDVVSLHVKVRPTPVDELGGQTPTWTAPAQPISCYVEVIVDRVQRPDGDQQQPKSVRTYRVFAPSDTGALIDDHVVWGEKTLVVTEPSVIQEPLWMFEATDVG